jgi:hypothetical protein
MSKNKNKKRKTSSPVPSPVDDEDLEVARVDKDDFQMVPQSLLIPGTVRACVSVACVCDV